MGKVIIAAAMAAAVTAVIKIWNRNRCGVKAAPVFCDHITEKQAPSGYTKEKQEKRSDIYGSYEYQCKTV